MEPIQPITVFALLMFLLLMYKIVRRPSDLPSSLVPSEGRSLQYAGFWRRLGALLIDALVMFPLVVFSFWCTSFSREYALAGYVLVAAISWSYYIYGHARFGQTLGKWVTGVQVTRLDGSAIGWRQALLRSSVNLVFGVLGLIALAVALMTVPDEQFHGLAWQARLKNIGAFKPAALGWADDAEQIWFWSEVVVMLFNAKRRALHDYVAGTVVILKKP
jgi:uncharacterized RDD family membrane protein YckC